MGYNGSVETSYTCDMGYAAALLTLGYTILPELISDENESERKMFGFEMEQKVFSVMLEEYRKGDLFGNLRKNSESIRQLKKMLHANSS